MVRLTMTLKPYCLFDIIKHQLLLLLMIFMCVFPTHTCADGISDFADFLKSKKLSGTDRYVGLGYQLMSTTEPPAHLSQTLSSALRLEDWKLGVDCRICQGLVLEREDQEQLLKESSEWKGYALDGCWMKNSTYHASLANVSSGEFALERIFLNSQRPSEEEPGVDLLLRLANMPVAISELPGHSGISNAQWSMDSQGNRTFSCLLADVDGEVGVQKLDVTFSENGFLKDAIVVSESENWRHEYAFEYKNNDLLDEQLIDNITREAYGLSGPQDPIISRWIFRNWRRVELTDADCRLPAFGLPEPAGFGPQGVNPLIIGIMVVAGIAICTGAYLKFVRA